MIITETSSDDVHALAREAVAVAASQVAYAEVRATIGRGKRAKRFSERDTAVARALLDARWLNVAKVPVDDAVGARAGEIAGRHALRALDAVHVASAISLLEGGQDVIFASFDRDQREGARGEGLVLFPESL